MKRLTVALVALTAVQAWCRVPTGRELYARTRDGLAEVRCGDGDCLGFVAEFASGGKYLVTDGRVANGGSAVTALSLSGRPIPLGAPQYARDLDLVRFAVPTSVVSLQVDRSRLSPGDRVFLFARAAGRANVRSVGGTVKSVGSRQALALLPVAARIGGCAVLNGAGAVVGAVASASPGRAEGTWMLDRLDSPNGLRFAVGLDRAAWTDGDWASIRLLRVRAPLVRSTADVTNFSPPAALSPDERARRLGLSRSLAQCFARAASVGLGETCDVRRVVCDRCRTAEAEYVRFDRTPDRPAELFGIRAFSAATVFLTAKSRTVWSVGMTSDGLPDRLTFDSLVRKAESVLDMRAQGGLGEDARDAFFRFPDGRCLILASRGDGTVSAVWQDEALSKAVRAGLERDAFDEASAPESFLGVELGSEFMGMISSLHSSRRESALHMSAKFRPKKIFLNFLDYRISFSTKTGRIGQVYCLKKASVGGLSGWLDWLMDKLEEKYGRTFHLRHRDGEISQSWEMPFYASQGRQEGERAAVLSLMVSPLDDTPGEVLVVLMASKPSVADEYLPDAAGDETDVDALDAL